MVTIMIVLNIVTVRILVTVVSMAMIKTYPQQRIIEL
jgi:hypothetical protein